MLQHKGIRAVLTLGGCCNGQIVTQQNLNVGFDGEAQPTDYDTFKP